MPTHIIYYHDPVEVDPNTSWTGLCPILKNARRINISKAANRRVTALFGYARPDAVITADDRPVLSIEQTQMNPSGHNIPQRFSFQVRAAEFSVPSILYYPEYSRRTFSDPNPRYAQIRVPLAQRRLTKLYDVPALSIFWPTNSATLLPDTRQEAHKKMAQVVDALVSDPSANQSLMKLPEVIGALEEMERVVLEHVAEYGQNPSVRALFPDGFDSSRTRDGISIDPPEAATLMKTTDFLAELSGTPANGWSTIESQLLGRPLTMLFKGTPNKAKTDSEHPWPGYLTLLDVLYLRKENGRTTTQRDINLAYRLPVSVKTFMSRVNQREPPTATFIADSFADVIMLDGGVIAGRSLRMSTAATPIRITR